MITIYCKDKHKANKELCKNCKELLEYARSQLLKCPLKENKPACSACKIHCYKNSMREKIKKIMKYSGPRIVFKHPVLTLLHYLK